MPEERPIFSASLYWIEADTDLGTCQKCQEIIYGKMFHPVVMFGEPIEESEFSDIQIRLCESCYSLHRGKL